MRMKREGSNNNGVTNFDKYGNFPSTDVWKQIEILLERNQESDFGFSLGRKGEWNLLRGSDSQWEDRYRGHVITNIKAGSAADREGTLQIGDRLLEVNGTSVENMSPKMIMQLLQQSGNFAVILIQYKTNKLDFKTFRQLPVRIRLPKMQAKSLDVTLSCTERNNGRKKSFVVDSIYEAGHTERMGLLCVGDEVLEINGEQLTSLQRANELLDGSFEESWLEMVILPSHHKTRLKQVNTDDDGDKSSNEIKFRRSPEHDNFPDVTRTKSDMLTSEHHWTSETTSCYPDFPVTMLSSPFKAIKNVFNNCDPLRHSLCSTNRRRLSSHHDVYFKKGYAQPVKFEYLQTYPVETTPKDVNNFEVRRFAPNKQTPVKASDLTYSVLLTKPKDLELGIRLRSEENDKTNIVDFIEEFSLADQTKAIHVGDEIIRVNGLELCGLSREDAQNLIVNEFANGDELCLVIRKTTRGKNVKRNFKSFDSAVGSWNHSSLDNFDGRHPNSNQKFQIGNPREKLKVRAVVHHSLNDLGNIATSKTSSSSEPVPSLMPKKYGSIKINVSPLLNHKRNSLYQTSTPPQLYETLLEEIKIPSHTKERATETQQLTGHDSSKKLEPETCRQNDSRLDMLLSTLHHIDSDPPSPTSRLSNLFDFLDSEDDIDLPRPIMLHAPIVESQEKVLNSMAATSSCETSDSNRPIIQVSNISKSKQKIDCSKTTNGCVCSLMYLTCSTSGTTTTKHTSGCPRLDSTSHHCNYVTQNNTTPNKKNFNSTIPNKNDEQERNSGIPEIEISCDKWSKLFESVQFSSVESFNECIEDPHLGSHIRESPGENQTPLNPILPKDHNINKPTKEDTSVRFECDTPSSTEEESSSMELITVTLTRRAPEDSFGFGLSDGIEESGIFVSGIMPGGPAENKLQVFDKVFQVNGIDTETMSTSDLIDVVKEAGCELNLVVCRNSES